MPVPWSIKLARVLFVTVAVLLGAAVDRGLIKDEQQRVYQFFRDKVARDLAEFRHALPHVDCGLWFARRDDATVGSVAIDGRARENGAHLRWFIVDDRLRGGGVGAALIDSALAFCRQRAFDSVYLWTFAGLDAARRLYEARGFRLEQEVEAETWGRRVREQKFRLYLAP